MMRVEVQGNLPLTAHSHLQKSHYIIRLTETDVTSTLITQRPPHIDISSFGPNSFSVSGNMKRNNLVAS